MSDFGFMTLHFWEAVYAEKANDYTSDELLGQGLRHFVPRVEQCLWPIAGVVA